MAEVKKVNIKFKLDNVAELKDPVVCFDNMKKAFVESHNSRNAIIGYMVKKGYDKGGSEINDLAMLISDTHNRIDLTERAVQSMYDFVRTAIMSQFHLSQNLHDAIDELKKDPTKKETLDKIDSIRKEQSILHEKYDKFEPIANGVQDVIDARAESMDKE